MELQPDKRKQFHQVLSKNFTLGELKQLSDFALNKHLDEITTSQNLPEVALELINWAESKNFLPELIEGAQKINPRSTILQELIGHIPKPLQLQPEPTIPIQEQPEAPSPVENPVEPQSEPIDINTKRYLRPTNKGDTEQIIQGTEISPPISPLLFPLSAITELRNHINAAKESIQNVYNIFLPEKEVFRDQCRLAIKQVQAAYESIEKDLAEKIHVLYIHAPARSLLELERTYFCEEARKTVTFLQEFASQTSSLPLRKKIWEKLQLLMRSLQDSNALIDALLEGIQE